MKKIFIMAMSIIYIFYFLLKTPLAAPALLITNVTITPPAVIPGKNFSIEFNLKNNSSRIIDSIVLKVQNLEGKSTLSEFSPVGINEAYLDSLGVNADGVIKIHMVADSQIKTGVYNLVINMSYNEKGLDTVEESRLIGIVVNRPVNLLITNLEVSNDKEIKAEIVNASSARIVDSTAYIYFNDVEKIKFLGTLEPNDENEIIENIPENFDSGKIRVKIDYKDELNKNFQVIKEILFEKKNAKNVSSDGLQERANIWYVLKRLFGIGI